MAYSANPLPGQPEETQRDDHIDRQQHRALQPIGFAVKRHESGNEYGGHQGDQFELVKD